MTDNKHDADHRAMMEGLYWWGIPTFFRCEQNPDCDIALVGIPHSTGNGTTERDQHLGPRAVRDVSALGRRVHMDFGFSPWDACRISDLGDVPLPHANNNERCIEDITEFFRRIDSQAMLPVSVGGDHSITGGVLQALGASDSRLSGGEPVALLHFDAHTDTFHQLDHFLGAEKSAAHWGSYLVRDGHVDPTKSVQIGIRGNPRTLDWLAPSEELGYRVITKDEFDSAGPEACISEIRQRIGNAPCYITFDLDCLDPTIAPGVSNLEAGAEGFRINQVMRLLRGARGLNIIGADIVCMMPTKDAPNKITALTAVAVMFELICLMADRVKA